MIRSGTVADAAEVIGHSEGSSERLGHWRVRLASVAPDAGIAAASQGGIRLVCPGNPGWPQRLDDFGASRPYALWVSGDADLQTCSAVSVSAIGSRAATAYVQHVARSIAADLADLGWAVVSGVALGVDACVHEGVLGACGRTIAILIDGPDIPYPVANASLLADIALRGAVLSEWPPGTRPSRQHFLQRDRIIAALSCGTVVVEAAQRRGTMASVHRAADLGRPLMAIPGPVTSAMSIGCHSLLREGRAACVTSAMDIAMYLREVPAT